MSGQESQNIRAVAQNQYISIKVNEARSHRSQNQQAREKGEAPNNSRKQKYLGNASENKMNTSNLQHETT